MSSSILVTGAAGFIGSHLVRELDRLGHRVRPHCRRDGDLARSTLDADGIDHVFHLAGRSFVPDSWSDPGAFYEVNVMGTINVLEFCRKRRISMTLVSSYVYGVPQHLPIDESHPRQPSNPYGHSKILAEEAVEYYGKHLDLRETIVRPFNVYGPGQDERFLIPTLINQALDPRCDQVVVQDMRPKRDYLHVHDMVNLLVATLRAPDGAVYNAGSGQSVSIESLMSIINACLPRPKALVSTDSGRREEIPDVVADVTRARTELGWSPTIGLHDGIEGTLKWMEQRSVSR